MMVELTFAPKLCALAVITAVVRQTWAACGLGGMTEWKGKRLTDKCTLAAYESISGTICVVLFVGGCWGFLFDADDVWEDPLYGKSNTAMFLAELMTAYQLWNLAMCGLIKEYSIPANPLKQAHTLLPSQKCKKL